MSGPIVSIIMSTYNRAHVIKRAIDSVMAQSYKNYELIIIDDGSVDNTSSVVADYDDERIRYLNYSPNMGACHARNIGLEAAKGRLIAFLDSDDMWFEDALDYAVKALETKPDDVGGVFGRTEIYDETGEGHVHPTKKMIYEGIENNEIIKKMLLGNVMSTVAVFLRKECADRVGGFDENLERLQDWDYFLRAISITGYKIDFVDHVFTKIIRQNDSLSKNCRTFWPSILRIMVKNYDLIEEHGFQQKITENLAGIMVQKKDADYLLDSYEKFDSREKDIAYEVITYALDKQGDLQKDWLNALGELHKQRLFYHLLNKWIMIKQRGDSLITFFESKGIKTVAIYGMKELGQRLYDELKDSIVTVLYGIDRDESLEYRGLQIYSLEETSIPVDAVVVTAIAFYDSIRDKLITNGVKEVYSLAEIVDECLAGERLCWKELHPDKKVRCK